MIGNSQIVVESFPVSSTEAHVSQCNSRVNTRHFVEYRYVKAVQIGSSESHVTQCGLNDEWVQSSAQIETTSSASILE